MDWLQFELRSDPFSDAGDEAMYFATSEREALMDSVSSALRGPRCVVLIVGAAGVGKSAFVDRLLAACDGHARCARIRCTEEGSGDLVQDVCRQFGLPVAPTQGPAESMIHLRTFVGDDDPDRCRHIVAIDSAEHLDHDGLNQVAMMTRLRTPGGHGLHVVLIGRPELHQRLEVSAYPDICKRVAVAEKIEPFSIEQTGAYIRHRITAAGGDPDRLFSDEALTLLCHWSGGVPESIHGLASGALARAASCSVKVVRAAMIYPPQELEDGPIAVPVACIPATGDEAGDVPADNQVDVNGFTAAGIEPTIAGDGTNAATGSIEALAMQAQKVHAMAREEVRTAEDRLADLAAKAESSIRRLHDAIAEIDARHAVAGASLNQTDLEALSERANRLTVQAGERVGAIEEHLARMLAAAHEAVETRFAELTSCTAAATDTLKETFNQVTRSGDELDGRVQEWIQRVESSAANGLDVVDRRVAELTARVQEAIGAYETTSQTLEDRASVAARQIEELNGAKAHIEEAFSRVAALSERIEVTNRDAQEKVALLANGLDAGDGVYQRLLSFSEEIAAKTARFEEAAARSEERIQAVVKESKAAKQTVHDTFRETSTRVDQKSDALVERAEAAAEILRGQLDLVETRSGTIQDDLMASLRRTVETEMLAEVREELNTMRSETLNAMRETLDVHQREAREYVAKQRADMEAAIGGFIRDHVQSLEHRTGVIEERLENAEEVTADLALNINAANAKGQQLASHISSAGDLVQTLADANGGCRESLRALSEGTETANAVRIEIENLRDSITGDIKHAGLNAQNVLRDLLGRVQDQVAVADRGVEAIRNGESTLREVIDDATRTAQEAGETVDGLKTQVESIEGRCDAAQLRVEEMTGNFEQVIARTESDLEQRLHDAEARIASHADAFNANIGARFQEADARFATVGEELKQTIDDRIADADDRIARRLEDAQRLFDDRSAEVQGRIDRAIDELRNSIDERMAAFTTQSQELRVTQKQLLAASDTAHKQIEKVDAQATIARELLVEQSRRTEDHRRLVTELAEQVAKGEAITSHFEGIKDGALEAYAQLAERSEVAAALFERTSELELQIEQREQELAAQGHALATFSEEREAIELRVQQLYNSTDSLRVELGSLLSQPQKLVCEAKAQALQLNDVCRAVKKVFAGLSQASLEANRRIEELRRLETVATALQGWVNETANTQRRLTTALAPALAGPAPVVATVEPQEQAPSAPAVASARPGPTKPAPKTAEKIAAAAAAVAKSKSHRIDKLIREARRKTAERAEGQGVNVE